MRRNLTTPVELAELTAWARRASAVTLAHFYGYQPGDKIPEDIRRIDDKIAKAYASGKRPFCSFYGYGE